MSGTEFNDGVSPELVEKAVKLEGLIKYLLEEPDWEQMRMHFEAPYGPDSLDLLASASSGSIGSDRYNTFRSVKVKRSDSGEINLCRFMLNLDHLPEEPRKNKYPDGDEAAALLEDGKTADPEAAQLVADSLHLYLNGYDQSIADGANMHYASLLMKGTANRRYGIRRAFPDDTKVYFMISGREGDQPWEKVDNEPVVQSHVFSGGRAVGFELSRDGEFETYEMDPDTGRAIRSIVGESMTIEDDGQVVEIDLGENAAKKAVVLEAERAIGLRDLDEERLDFIEKGVSMVAQDGPEQTII